MTGRGQETAFSRLMGNIHEEKKKKKEDEQESSAPNVEMKVCDVCSEHTPKYRCPACNVR